MTAATNSGVEPGVLPESPQPPRRQIVVDILAEVRARGIRSDSPPQPESA